MKHRNAGHSVAALLCASLLAVPAGAADLPAAQTGQRVRISAAAPGVFQGVATGTLIEVGEEGLTLAQADGGAVLKLPRASVMRLEVSEGRRRHTRRGLLLGLALGLGAVPLVMADKQTPCGDVWDPHPCTQGERMGIAAGVAAVFTGAGAWWGHRQQTEQWRDTPLDHLKVTVRPTRGGGRVAVALAF